MQRDAARGAALRDCLVGELTPDEMEEQRILLEKATRAASVKGLPSFETLLPYFDQKLYSDAERKIAFGNDVASEGNVRMHQNPWFVWMIVAGYEAITQGNKGRLKVLIDLRNRLQIALEGSGVPDWSAESNKLFLDGVVVRRVRGKDVAGNIRLLLDEFQRNGWPRRIDAPKDFKPESLRETVRSLNRGLSRIKFCSDGDGKGVYWERV